MAAHNPCNPGQAPARIPSQRSIRSFLFEIWWPKFASELPGRVRIRIRIRSRIAATAVHSALQDKGKKITRKDS